MELQFCMLIKDLLETRYILCSSLLFKLSTFFFFFFFFFFFEIFT